MPEALRMCYKDSVRYFLLLLALAATGCSQDTSSPIATTTRFAAAKGGRWSPQLTDVDGRPHEPFADPSVKAVVLIFVMQDCPIANSYIPAINRLHETYSLRGVRWFIVHTDPSTSVEKAREHRKAYEVQPIVALDTQHALVWRTGATKTPEAAVLSRDGGLQYLGRIDDRYAALGKSRQQATTHDLEDAIEAVLANRAVPKPWGEAVGCNIPDLPKAE